MNWLGRFLAFALAVLVGMAAAWVGLLFSERLVVPDLNEPVSWTDAEPTSAVSPSGITVAYAGLHSDADSTLYLKFIVHNGLYRPVTYGAHFAEGPFVRLKANGEELPALGRCGTGIETFYILPGRSAEFHVAAYEFLKLPKKNDRVAAGFYLKPALTEEYGPYYLSRSHCPRSFES
jgi:hypothetical protein